ncbi:hypothetical protein Acsp06_46100 [Actinomycetospora sp. NBRC 106375]|nr:hypothetical protein Acsp06_46100 [Actinomycetospora sp. NBRC 106375]
MSDLRENVSVTAVPDSDILIIEGDGPSAEDARTLTSTVASSYGNYSRESEKRALQDQADGMQRPIDSVRARLGTVSPAQEGARTALNNQLADFVERQEQLRTAAEIFPGQVQVLAAADFPERPSSLTPALGAATGGAIGLLLAGAWLLFRYRVAVRNAFGADTGERHRDRH